MGKSSKGINLTFIIIMLLFFATLWASTMKEKDGTYTRGELVTQLEKGEVAGVKIQPNEQIPTGTLIVSLTNGSTNKLYVSDVVEMQKLLAEYNIDPVVEDVPQENWFISEIMPLLLIIIAIPILITVAFFLKNNPKIKPTTRLVIVKPTKYGPKGLIIAPIKSPSPATAIA